jgi:hypothetical protein
MSENKSIHISSVELSDTDYSVLRVAVKLLTEKSDIEFCLLEKGNMSGLIIVVDVDASSGNAFYSQFDYANNRTLLLLSTKIFTDHRSVVLKKPVRVQTLRDTLYDITMSLFSHFTTKVVSPPAVTTSPLLGKQETLFSILLKVKQENLVIQAFCSPYPPLFINAPQKIVATSASREIIRRIIRTPPGAITSTKLSNSDHEALARGQVILAFNNILWSAGLYGSQGQLIRGHSPEIAVQLRAWPNLTRLEFDHDHLKLAAVMTQHALTLKQVEEKTKLPWETIVGFYNATWATDLVLINPKGLPTVTVPLKSGKTSLLAKIAQRLKFVSI